VSEPHPLDEEAPEDVVFTVTAIHRNSHQVGVGTDDDCDEAVRKAKDDLLNKLEQVGGC
jgi:hypothetical protein